MTKDTDYIEGPGFRMSRMGRHILFDTHRTPEEHRQIQEALVKRREELPEQIEAKVAALEDALAQFETFDIIANLLFRNLFVDPETYKEYEHQGSAALVEYVALLCLKRPYTTVDTLQARVIDWSQVERIQSMANEIFWDTVLLEVARSADPDRVSPPTALEELRFNTITHHLGVRSPGYYHHQVQLLRHLFSPFDDCILQTAGFTSDDALAFAHTISEIINKRLADCLSKARAAMEQACTDLRDYLAGRTPEGDTPDEMLKSVAQLQSEEQENAIRGMMFAWVSFVLGGTFSLTPSDLSQATQRPYERAAAYLDAFSLEFGDVEPDFCLPTPTHPLKVRPLMHHEGRYLCAALAYLVWGMQARLEDIVEPEWERYQKHRNKILEAESIRLISSALGTTEAYRNLQYRPNETDPGTSAELDGMVVFDRALFLVECKAGEFTPPARRGAPKRMLGDLKKLLGDAHYQALRAKRYIESSQSPRFTLPNGEELVLDRNRFRHIFMVTTTLEPLGVFTAVLNRVGDTGIFTDTDMPWAVCLLDLRVICEIIEFPSQLVHYIIRRLRVTDLGKFMAPDELDWFGHYLTEGLYFEEFEKSGLDYMRLLTYTTQFDDYYIWLTGERQTPAEKPSQPMPSRFRRVVRELERVRTPGYTDVTLHLLDMGVRDRVAFAAMLRRCRRLTAQDRGIHDFTLGSSEWKAGITVMAAPADRESEVYKKLVMYCHAKKYQMRCDKWVGIMSVVGRRGLVDAWVADSHPWQQDAQMDALLRQFPFRHDP